MWAEFCGSGLLVFSDPAGAKACLGLEEILRNEQVRGRRRLISNKHYPFYSQFSTDVEVILNINAAPVAEKCEGVDWIFTGTSHPDSSNAFELIFLQIIDVKSYSFIDHWINFNLRFQLHNKLVLPDVIFVLDNVARDMAIAEGLPATKIRLLENPYLYYLKKYAPKPISKFSFCEKLNINVDSKIVLYAPDPISLRLESEQNELTVLSELLDLSKENFTLLLKLHPLQPTEKISQMIKERPDVKIISDTELHPSDVFKNVDFIVGFYSNYLLEASTLNNNIISYNINTQTAEHLKHILKSLVVNNKPELKSALK